MSDIHTAFRRGATILAQGQSYGDIHREMGLLEPDWTLLTSDEHWTPAESRRIRSVLAGVIEVALTIAGQYAAAVIAIVVSPANRLVACYKVPETFDAVAASGLHADFEVRPMRPEQMMALVLAYSGGLGGEPPVERLNAEVVDMIKKEKAK